MNRRWISLAFFASACAGSSTGNTTAAPPAPSRVPGAAWPDEGPATWTPRPTETAITANDLRTRLYQFADDSMQGRRIGEIGNYKGTDYVAREFQRLGLKPAGDNGTYFQNLPYGPAGIAEASSSLTVAGAPVAVRTDWVPVPPALNTLASDHADLNAQTVFAGRWGDTTIALDPATYRGKVLVFTAAPSATGFSAGGRGQAGLPPRCDSLPNRFGAAAAAAVEAEQRANARGAAPAGRGAQIGGARDMRASTAGAAGVLLITLDPTTRASAATAFNTRNMMQPAPTPATNVPMAAISAEAAQRIFGRPVNELVVGTTGQTVAGHWVQEFHVSPTPGRNVIAVLPGSDPARANEYVIVGAHNDHVGVNPTSVDHDSLRAVNIVTRRQGANDPVCRPTAEQQRKIDELIAHARSVRPVRRDSIMNGADDDGSGTVILLEVAERFAKEHPARTILFISHEGEEAGLLGSRYFTDHPTIDLKQVDAVLNMDMEAKGRPDQVINGAFNSIQTLGSRRLSREYGDIIDSIATNNKSNPIAIDHTWDVPANPMNRFCRSDQVNYVRKDIPTTYFSTGYAYDYHQPTDEPRYADYDHMARIGNFIHDIMNTVADRPHRLTITGADPAYPSCGR